ncbi:putative Fe-Mo cluster-binding NifX family protein [Thermodesulfitimonas autotrophica]|uniref:Putative Fe-Mo cluster-binding NifX family protein n=2 Tax=Thermodesulfitimonas autotrophica TaxID=1894989 RepID=A0A3N5C188_9THEO|nr:NifB/NifX family molybdenum-iron cluster-binding protein [Thermodesulfitimonas autotrophica]RPF49931.1 putative Fe-Mo cluster-binding NifX family protein [Thermodesulfitimonas autotrophica]
MKVAVATENGYVAQHFGHCPAFTLAEVVNGQVKEKTVIPNPGHQPGFLPGYLADLGVTHVIAGGIGARAQELFLSRGVVPLVGVRGRVDEALDAFLAGRLATGPSLCDHGAGEHGHGRCGGGCGGQDR